MRISFVDALTRAWNRMVDMLFRPFELEKWVVLGFSAWLANLVSGRSGGAGTSVSDQTAFQGPDDIAIDGGSAGRGTDTEFSFEEVWRQASDWLASHPWLLAAIFAFAAFLVTVLILLTWISSRAKFVFLDNVVEDRAWIKEPWSRLGALGDSLFAFRVGFGLLNFVIVLGFLGVIGAVVWSMSGTRGFTGLSASSWIALAAISSGIFVLSLVVSYVHYFLDGFVVPIMVRTGLTVMPAWSRFADLFRRHWDMLLLSGLFSFLLHMLALTAIVVVGCLTCCIGFIALAIPYFGTLILLPWIVTYRLFTVELLGDLDSDLRLLMVPSQPSPGSRRP